MYAEKGGGALIISYFIKDLSQFYLNAQQSLLQVS